MRGEVIGEITTVGIDLAKRVVSLHAEDAAGRVALRKTLRREAPLDWFVERSTCVVALEACIGAHHFGTLLVQGARSALQAALRVAPARRTRLAAWIATTYARIGYHKTLVAIANKHVRLVWALLIRDEPLRAHLAVE